MGEWSDWCDMREHTTREARRRSNASDRAMSELKREGNYSLDNLIARTNRILDESTTST